MPDMMLSTDTCVYIYAAIAFSTLLLCIVRSIIYYYMMLRISRRLHDSMFCAVIGAAMRFFDTNPSGMVHTMVRKCKIYQRYLPIMLHITQNPVLCLNSKSCLF